MKSGITLGAGAGLAGGLVAAFVLSILVVKGHEGQIARPITLLSHIVGGSSLAAGGLVLIVVATAFGALFGVLYTALGLRRETAAWSATLYGIAWWIVGWFAVMPPPLRLAPWEALAEPALFQLAVAGLLACLGFGAALAGAFTLLGPVETSTGDARLGAARGVTRSNGALTAGRR
jgi:hypothetical protein